MGTSSASSRSRWAGTTVCTISWCQSQEIAVDGACKAHRRDVASLDAALNWTLQGESLLRDADKPTEWVWGPDREGLGMISRSDVVALGAYSGEGKTTLISGLIASAVRGSSLMGLPVAGPKRVLFITEAGQRQVKRLFYRSGITKEEAERITTVFSTSVTSNALLELCNIREPNIVVIDSLTSIAPGLALHGGGDFSWTQPNHTTTVATFFRELVRRCDLDTLVYLCHTTKVGKPDIKSFRGTGAVVEHAESAWILEPSKDSAPGRLVRVKAREAGETLPSRAFSFDVSTGRFNAPTDTTKAAKVVEYIKGHSPCSKNSVVKGVGGRRGTVLRVLDHLLDHELLILDKAGNLDVPAERDRD